MTAFSTALQLIHRALKHGEWQIHSGLIKRFGLNSELVDWSNQLLKALRELSVTYAAPQNLEMIKVLDMLIAYINICDEVNKLNMISHATGCDYDELDWRKLEGDMNKMERRLKKQYPGTPGPLILRFMSQTESLYRTTV